jgi:hypothetical protein
MTLAAPIWAAPPKAVADITTAAAAEKPAATATTPKDTPKANAAAATEPTACHRADAFIGV